MNGVAQPVLQGGIGEAQIQLADLGKAVGTVAVLPEHGVGHALGLVVHEPQILVQHQEIVFPADLQVHVVGVEILLAGEYLHGRVFPVQLRADHIGPVTFEDGVFPGVQVDQVDGLLLR